MTNTLATRTLRRTGVVAAGSALALAATVTGGVTAASATATATATATAPTGSVTVADPRTDMAGHGADLFWVRLVNRDRVKVVLQHRNLVRSWRPESSGVIYLDTDRSTTGADYALVGALYSGADYALYETDGWKIRYARPADGFYDMDLRYDTDRTLLRIARSTLGNPAAVRASVHVAGVDDEGRTVHDFAPRANAFTPWVRRG